MQCQSHKITTYFSDLRLKELLRYIFGAVQVSTLYMILLVFNLKFLFQWDQDQPLSNL